MRFLTVLGLSMLLASSTLAQPYPVSGDLYLSFDPSAHVFSRNVAPGESFVLWLIADIPFFESDPDIGIAGLEGSVAFPPSIQILSFSFLSGAIDLGGSFSEPGLRTFVVGLGDCYPLGAPRAYATLTAQLLEDASDVEIGVSAPAIGAAAISSFSGIGPGWATSQCNPTRQPHNELYLFEPPLAQSSSVLLNPSTVGAEAGSFARLKALY